MSEKAHSGARAAWILRVRSSKLAPSYPPRNPRQLSPDQAAAVTGERGRPPRAYSGSPLSPYNQRAKAGPSSS